MRTIDADIFKNGLLQHLKHLKAEEAFFVEDESFEKANEVRAAKRILETVINDLDSQTTINNQGVRK